MSEIASAYVSILPSFKGGEASITKQLDGPISKASQTVGKTSGAAYGNSFSTSAGGVMKAALGAAVIAGAANAAKDFIGSSIDEAREAQKVGATTEQIIKTTGGAAKITAAQVGDLATAISLKTGMDDEAIQSGANLLLTFKNVKNEVGEGANIFDRATAAAADLSAAGFGDLNGASKQLGKALNDPLKGMTALSRSGVTFTAEQKEQVKALVATGDILGAQKVILSEVEGQVGGTAAASATASEKMAVGWGNLQESIGTLLLPVIDQLQGVLTAAFAWISENTWVLGVFAGGVTAIALAMGVAKIATIQWSATLLASPITWIVVGIVALIAALVLLIANWDSVVAWLKKVWGGIVTWLGGVWDSIVSGVRAGWDAVVRWIKDAATKVVGFFMKWSLIGVIASNWDSIKSGATSAWNGIVDWIKGVPGKVVGFFQRWTIVGQIASHWTQIKTDVEDIWGKILDFFKGIPGKIGGAFSGLGSALTSPFRSAFNSIAGFWNRTVGSLSFSIPDWVPGIGGNSFSLPKIPLLAQGGVVTSATAAILGEGAEPEAVLPLSRLDGMLERAASSGGTPRELVVVDSDGALIGRMRVEAGGVMTGAVRPLDAGVSAWPR